MRRPDGIAAPVALPCILGPTGAGKTAAALALALAFPGPVRILNADSRQVYREFPLITAQPSPEEQAAVPHRLYGFLPLSEKLGAGSYSRLADAAIRESLDAGALPVLVGGTGLYLKTLFAGIAPIPEVPADVLDQWRRACAAEGGPALHRLLGREDPEYAAKIHPHDRQRIVRALAVLQATGKPFSLWHKMPPLPSPYRPVKVGVGLPLSALEIRIRRRLEAMLEAGALEEARRAFVRFPDPSAPGWTAIGCRELLAHLNGLLSLEECRELWFRNTRAYAKRQLTWFRPDREITWFSPDQASALAEHVLEHTDFCGRRFRLDLGFTIP
ncbi:MAG: tRNA (adenosine(37)-N6)-dimethylallyltransferase MiaA [Desulfovibrio sp.]|nr:tRNA (adenosine(37)-N6)-dimethylallyltransferase MiaA [Desulfovibrio sp.]